MSKAMSRTLILVPLLLVILVALFFLLRPSATISESTDAEPQQKNFELAIKGGNSMTPNEISVNEGDHVNLMITSDEPLEFHLHGYDLAKDLEAGEPAELSFDATNTGRFDIEAHLDEQTHEELGELLVQPR